MKSLLLLIVLLDCVISIAGLLETFNAWLFSSSLEGRCPYSTDLFNIANASLAHHIHGQDIAVDTILNSLGAWELSRHMRSDGHGESTQEPLVFAFTGPTGVGKSETSYRLAEAILSKRRRRDGSAARLDPKGYLKFRGEDYSNTSDLAEIGIGEIQQIMRSRIVAHLESCDGNAVIVFDEVQKIMPGALEFLLSALDDRGTLSYTRYLPTHHKGSGISSMITSGAERLFGKVNWLDAAGESEKVTRDGEEHVRFSMDRKLSHQPQTREFSTSNAVFIFISDIGTERMNALLLSYGQRENIPLDTLRLEVKQALDEQWDRLRFGKTIKGVVPFLPLEPPHLKNILIGKLQKLSNSHKGSFWHDLVVDEDVSQYLIGPNFIDYDVHKTTILERGSRAMEVSSGGGAGECQDGVCAADFSATADTGNAQGGGRIEDGSIPTTLPRRKVFARHGARSLENAGPLQDLRSHIYRRMMPWKPGHILHIGLLQPGHESLYLARWGRPESPVAKGARRREIYFQWCDPDDLQSDKLALSGSTSALLITHDMAFSNACETKWFGAF